MNNFERRKGKAVYVAVGGTTKFTEDVSNMDLDLSYLPQIKSFVSGKSVVIAELTQIVPEETYI